MSFSENNVQYREMLGVTWGYLSLPKTESLCYCPLEHQTSAGMLSAHLVCNQYKMEGKMSPVLIRLAVALALVSLPAAAGFFVVNTAPFTGSTAPATPGRQV